MPKLRYRQVSGSCLLYFCSPQIQLSNLALGFCCLSMEDQASTSPPTTPPSFSPTIPGPCREGERGPLPVDRMPSHLPDQGVLWCWVIHSPPHQAPGARMQPQSCPTGPSLVCGDFKLRKELPGGQASRLSILHLSALKYLLLGPRVVV